MQPASTVLPPRHAGEDGDVTPTSPPDPITLAEAVTALRRKYRCATTPFRDDVRGRRPWRVDGDVVPLWIVSTDTKDPLLTQIGIPRDTRIKLRRTAMSERAGDESSPHGGGGDAARADGARQGEAVPTVVGDEDHHRPAHPGGHASPPPAARAGGVPRPATGRSTSVSPSPHPSHRRASPAKHNPTTTPPPNRTPGLTPRSTVSSGGDEDGVGGGATNLTYVYATPAQLSRRVFMSYELEASPQAMMEGGMSASAAREAAAKAEAKPSRGVFARLDRRLTKRIHDTQARLDATLASAHARDRGYRHADATSSLHPLHLALPSSSSIPGGRGGGEGASGTGRSTRSGAAHSGSGAGGGAVAEVSTVTTPSRPPDAGGVRRLDGQARGWRPGRRLLHAPAPPAAGMPSRQRQPTLAVQAGAGGRDGGGEDGDTARRVFFALTVPSPGSGHAASPTASASAPAAAARQDASDAGVESGVMTGGVGEAGTTPPSDTWGFDLEDTEVAAVLGVAQRLPSARDGAGGVGGEGGTVGQRRPSMVASPQAVLLHRQAREAGRGPSRHDISPAQSTSPATSTPAIKHVPLPLDLTLGTHAGNLQAATMEAARRLSIAAQGPPSVDERNAEARAEEQRVHAALQRGRHGKADRPSHASSRPPSGSRGAKRLSTPSGRASPTRGIFITGAWVEDGGEREWGEGVAGRPASAHLGNPRAPSHPVGIWRTPLALPVSLHRKVAMRAIVPDAVELGGGDATSPPRPQSATTSVFTSRPSSMRSRAYNLDSTARPEVTAVGTMPPGWGQSIPYLEQTTRHYRPALALAMQHPTASIDTKARRQSHVPVSTVPMVLGEPDVGVWQAMATVWPTLHTARTQAQGPESGDAATGMPRARPRLAFSSALGYEDGDGVLAEYAAERSAMHRPLAAQARPHVRGPPVYVPVAVAEGGGTTASPPPASRRHGGAARARGRGWGDEDLVANVPTPVDYRLAAVHANTESEIMALVRRQASALKTRAARAMVPGR